MLLLFRIDDDDDGRLDRIGHVPERNGHLKTSFTVPLSSEVDLLLRFC